MGYKLIREMDDYVWMHNLIREMGQEIVREKCANEPEGYSHLWNADDIYQVLKNNIGTKAIQSIILDTSKIKELHLSPRVFKNMANLKLLKFYKSYGQCRLHLTEGLESLPNQLRLFHWEQYPSKSLPLNFCGENLVELSMRKSRVEKLRDGVQDLPNLKSIDLSFSQHLIMLPDFSKALNLECVNLNGCCSLVEIHESILSIHQLVFLEMTGCRNIKSLKSDVHLKSSRTLKLDYCSGLQEFSVISREMKFLNLSFTAIDELPRSIKFLMKLTELYIHNCENLKHIPNELSELRSLQNLHLGNCKNLDPSNLCILFDGLGSLLSLWLENCYNLCELPDNISNLSQLIVLTLVGCKLQRITNLPPSIGYLYASKCKRLQSISAFLPSIIHLDASDCKRLKSIMLISPFIEDLVVSNDGRLQTISVLPPSAESIFGL